jgi:DNA polymerase-3 subunit delta'
MARILDSVLGHEKPVQVLLSAVADDRLAGTLIFAGTSGIGKKRVALGLAQALVCERARTACGVCGSCLRIEKQQSESLMVVEPSGAGIKIEQARDILQFINLQKLARARVIIIDQAQVLGPQAGNALLKALEEPPEGTHFILITSNIASLLPTIRSRAQAIRFQPLSLVDLRKITSAEDWILRSAQGSVESAMQLKDEGADWGVIRNEALAVWAHLFDGRIESSYAKLRELAPDRGASVFVAQVWQKWLRDLLLLNSTAEADLPQVRDSLINLDHLLTLREASNLGLDELGELSELSLRLEQDLVHNVDRSLAFENFWFAFKRALSGESVSLA